MPAHARDTRFWISIFCSISLLCLAGGSIAGTAGAAPLSGVVTNELTSDPVEGVAVVLDPAVEGVDITTAANGTYSADVPADLYTVSFEDDRFEEQSEAIEVTSEGAVVDAILVPIAEVILTITIDGDAIPDATVTAHVDYEIMDGSTFQSVLWTQSQSVPVVITDEDMQTASVLLPGDTVYRDELIHVLESPPLTEDQLPPNVELPPGGFVGGLQDRFQVVGVNPFALENAGHVGLQVVVTTTSGDHSGEGDIHTTLPWKTASGIRNVPLGRPVLLHAKSMPLEAAGPYDWTLNAPGSSSAELMDPTSQSPWFVPDRSGKYSVEVTDPTAAPGSDPVLLEIYSGSYAGAITGKDSETGLPESDGCTFCHNGGAAPDQFTPWKQTGHAAIFSDLLDTSSYYGEQCFACHTVGFDPDVDNGGIDDAEDYVDFLAAGLIGSVPADNWQTMLDDYPESASLANAQCENCHGPQGGTHMTHDPRMTLSSENCATCHGEPLRHARFQQWQLSAHSNYELAEEEGSSGNCSRCHTANGFLTWLPVLTGEEEGDPLASVVVDWTPDETHPQTCVTCHDPHSTGTTSGVGTDATVRISGDTPPLIAGFTATDVSHGAICMTCHNTRRGLRNDDTFDDLLAEGEEVRAPHGGAQADVLMGENAYFVEVGNRGRHSITDNVEHTCVTCHMEKTPPPDELAYNFTGTNHTFYASEVACVDCHEFTADVIQGPVETKTDELLAKQEEALVDLITELTEAGRKVDVDGEITITDAAQIEELAFGEHHGRQAITVVVGGESYGPTRVDRVIVRAGDDTDLGHLYDFASEAIMKAGWNWALIHNDGSAGSHNNAFTHLVLDESLEALAAPEPHAGLLALVATGSVGWLARRRRERGAR